MEQFFHLAIAGEIVIVRSDPAQQINTEEFQHTHTHLCLDRRLLTTSIYLSANINTSYTMATQTVSFSSFTDQKPGTYVCPTLPFVRGQQPSKIHWLM